MSLCKSSGLAIFAVVCLLGETTGSAHAQCDITQCATEWSGDSVISLGGLPGFTGSVARGINDAGQIVGESSFGNLLVATEWSRGRVINLGGLPGSTDNQPVGINDAGRAVGYSFIGSSPFPIATEWSGGSAINLGGLPGSLFSEAFSINDAGHAVGFGEFVPQEPPPPMTVPESSTWAMMLFGFAALALAGYRRAKAGHATLAR